MVRRRSKPASAPRAGFTLIEVLVAIFVLTVGLLGLSALQANGIRSSQEAYLRSQATFLAYQIIDQMRANGDTSYSLAKADTPAAPGIDCEKSVCTSANLAAYDIYYWLQQISKILPAGDGAITCTVATRVCVATVYWDESRSVLANDSFAMSTQL